ncbi:hypothetical protein JW887_03580 [Candidatus Dojkabacteria bacterium]|nr:hypothetical protein [Candidatus Dojkabacteria bacterium]
MNGDNPNIVDNNVSTDKTILLELTKFCYENFDRRRNKEWKFSIALWTALTAFIAVTLKEDININIPLALFVFIGGIIVVIESWLHWALFRANDVDKSKSHYYEEVLDKKLNVNYKSSEEYINAYVKNKGKKFATPLTHVMITIVLLMLSGFSVSYHKTTVTESYTNNKKTQIYLDDKKENRSCPCKKTGTRDLHRRHHH